MTIIMDKESMVQETLPPPFFLQVVVVFGGSLASSGFHLVSVGTSYEQYPPDGWLPMLCISGPGWPVAVPIRGVPRCLQYCGYVALLRLLSPFGGIRKTKAMSAPQKFSSIWIIPNVLFYTFS